MWTDIFIIKLFRAQCDLGQLYNLHVHVAAEAWQQYKTSPLLLSLSNDREQSNVMWAQLQSAIISENENTKLNPLTLIVTSI